MFLWKQFSNKIWIKKYASVDGNLYSRLRTCTKGENVIAVLSKMLSGIN